MKSEALIAGPVVLLKRLCTRSILSLGMLSASKGSERCECETMEHSHTVSLDFADQYYRRQLHCYNVTIRALPKVDFQAKQNKYYTAKRVDPASDAWTYFMKFHVFDAYFAAWDRVLYLDSGIAVQKPIQVWYSYAIVTGVITKVRRYLSTHATQNLLTNNVEFIISVCYFHAILKIHLPV
eukprot:m.379699 g.379699  ORF g.379699 m.379699 type:complete len:181 (-) comp20957_c2_seq13:692-1234(-)